MGKPHKILIVSPEIMPFAKTGGLADMVSSLAKALRRLGHDVRLVMPRYKCTSRPEFNIKPQTKTFDVPVGPQLLKAEIYTATLYDSVPVYLIGKDRYFWRDGLYTEHGRDFTDNAERFIFFCRAVLETCKGIGFQPDIIHLNEWQSGLIPVYLKTLYASDPFFDNTRTVFTIHNLGYQGNFWNFDLPLANLSWDLFTPSGVEFFGMFSFLKTGVVYSDLLTTVSPTYSREILTQDYGFRMEGVLAGRAENLHGILNGVDYDEWDPRTDTRIENKYGPDAILPGKAECRRELLSRFSLEADETTPLVCMISRLSIQKGIDLVFDNLVKILDLGVNLLVLGTGDPRFEKQGSALAGRFRGRFACRLEFDESLSHRIFGGSDMLLVPSRYEPSGLTQMYALKYGTVPVVRAVGGLDDSVTEYDPATGQGTGFKFSGFDLPSMTSSLLKAIEVFKNRTSWHKLMKNGMAADHSWSASATRYSALYDKLLTTKRG